MKQLHAGCISFSVVLGQTKIAVLLLERGRTAELIILVNALEFYLEHWAKTGACFGIDLIEVLFKGFFSKPVKSVWEPLICRELVKDVLLFFSLFVLLLLFLQLFRLLVPLTVALCHTVAEWLGGLQLESIVWENSNSVAQCIPTFKEEKEW